MKLFKTTLTVILMCIISLTCASVNRDEDTFRIDFLKQEILYHKDAVYYPFPFEDITINHEMPRIETNRERIEQLLCDGISYNERGSCVKYRPLIGDAPP
mgnify:CR=1 FL=1